MTAARPRGPRPPGPLHLGNLLRNPFLEGNRQTIERIHAAGYDDVRAAHAPIMMFVEDSGTRITDVAQRAQLTKATVVYLVNDLEQLGYLERVADPSDGRAKLVRPTARGHAMVAAVRVAIGEIATEWAELMGADEFTELARLLGRLNQALWPDES